MLPGEREARDSRWPGSQCLALHSTGRSLTCPRHNLPVSRSGLLCRQLAQQRAQHCPLNAAPEAPAAPASSAAVLAPMELLPGEVPKLPGRSWPGPGLHWLWVAVFPRNDCCFWKLLRPVPQDPGSVPRPFSLFLVQFPAPFLSGRGSSTIEEV